MRDPDLIGRAQRAATELERAYDRWRTMHGLSREPTPAVSSYVGYSLEEPWGEPRVVFGIEAREAEQLAALLDRHECNGPVYAGLAAMPGARPEQGQEFVPASGERGRVIVPTQVQPTMAEREAAWREATWREAAPREQEIEQPRSYDPPAAQEPDGEPPASAAEPAQAGTGDEPDPPEALAGDAEPDPAGFEPQADPASYAGDDDQDDQAEPAEAAGQPPGEQDDGGQSAAAWPRPGRGRGHVLPRQRRGARGGAGKQAQG